MVSVSEPFSLDGNDLRSGTRGVSFVSAMNGELRESSA